MRVARLLRAMESMQLIISVIGKSISSFIYIALLLLLYIFIVALFAMQIFRGKFDFYNGKPRANFDSFHFSFVTIFQILTMENWQVILYDGMRATNGFTAAIFFIIVIFFGNFVLLNLFLAVLLDSFMESGKEEPEKAKEEAEKEVKSF